MRDPIQAIQEHKEKVIKSGIPEKAILGVFLFGSQNYNCNTENSDVDTKCIVVRSFKEILFKTEKEAYIKKVGAEEQCNVMDITHFFSNLLKQNINFCEVLFTEYFWLNPRYKRLWNKYFIRNRENITRLYPTRCVESIVGQAIHTLKQNPLDGKKVGNAIRLLIFLKKYEAGEKYIDCIKLSPKDKEVVLKYKTIKVLPNEDKANEIQNEFIKIKELNKERFIFNQSAVYLEEELKKGIYKITKKRGK